MTAIQFYRWIAENNIEYHWEDRDGNQDVIIFPRHYQMEGFFEMTNPSLFDDGDFEIIMMHGYFAIWASDILDYYAIELKEVFNEKV